MKSWEIRMVACKWNRGKSGWLLANEIMGNQDGDI